MPTFQDFLAKQNSIYAAIQAEEDAVLETGTVIDPRIAQHQGGFGIMMHYPGDFVDQLVQFYNRIENTTTLSSLLPDALHTTLATHGLVANYHPMESTEDKERFFTLCASVGEAVADASPIQIRFERPVITKTTIVLPGQPNMAFWELSQQIIQHCASHNIKVTPPWGSHCTIARFIAQTSVNDLRQMVDVAHSLSALGPIQPTSVEVVAIETSSSNTVEKVASQTFALVKPAISAEPSS